MTLIILILETGKSSTDVSDYHPIHLINYSIVTKILAARIDLIANNLIQEDHNSLIS